MGGYLRSCHENLAGLPPSTAVLQADRRFRHGSAYPQGILCFTSQCSRSPGAGRNHRRQYWVSQRETLALQYRKASCWAVCLGGELPPVLSQLAVGHMPTLSQTLLHLESWPPAEGTVGSGASFPGEGTFPSASVWPTLLLQQNLYNWAIHLKKKKQTCIFSVSEAGKAKSSIVCAVSAKAFQKLRVLCSNVGQAPSSRTFTGSMNLLMRMQFSWQNIHDSACGVGVKFSVCTLGDSFKMWPCGNVHTLNATVQLQTATVQLQAGAPAISEL